MYVEVVYDPRCMRGRMLLLIVGSVGKRYRCCNIIVRHFAGCLVAGLGHSTPKVGQLYTL